MGTTATEKLSAAPRPDQEAYRQSLSLEFSVVVRELVEILGKKLVAYIGGAKDTRTVERWMNGSEPYNNPQDRIRLAFRVAKMLAAHESPGVAQSWFIGLNPDLGDRAPGRLFQSEDFETAGAQVLAAARSFLAGG
jgi:hypothetical protein